MFGVWLRVVDDKEIVWCLFLLKIISPSSTTLDDQQIDYWFSIFCLTFV